MKICRDCRQMKPLDEFYVHYAMADKHLNKCKICVKEHIKKYRKENPEKIAAIDKVKYEKAKLNPAYILHRLEYQRNYRTTEINRAHIFAQRKLRKNKPEFCDICKTRPAQDAHHPDYHKLEYILWLCKRCHMRLHHSTTLKERI